MSVHTLYNSKNNRHVSYAKNIYRFIPTVRKKEEHTFIAK